MFYYLRTISLINENILFSFDYFNGEKKIKYKLIVSGKEEIKSKIGTFNCYIVKPFHQGKLLKNEGDMKIWISDSEKRLPIRIQIKMKFGSRKLDLISIN